MTVKLSKVAYLVRRSCSTCDPTSDSCGRCLDKRYTLHWLTHDEVMRDLHAVTVVGSRRFGSRKETGLQSPRLYVACIPLHADEEFLRRLFSFYGTVVSVTLAKDLEGRSLGSAFVRMSHLSEAEEILTSEDRLYGGRLQIMPATHQELST